MNDRFMKLMRGSVLYMIYMAYKEGLTNATTPRTLPKMVLETSLQLRGIKPEGRDMPETLEWLEGAEYVTVEWAMDNRRDYDSVTLTQKGINLILNRNAAKDEPNLTLPPRV